jgi:hypothetical protein
MTREDEERVPPPEREADGQAREDEQAREEAGRDGRVRPPTPEEAPELLGERSDYPAPFGEGS